MTELKPCPFCGGKAVLCENTDYAYVYCKECGSQTDESHGTAGAAVAAWNTRAERTCHLERIPYEPGEYEGMRCSVCKTVDLEMGVGPYCPGCGAKVVE